MESKRMLQPKKALELFGIRGLCHRPIVCKLKKDIITTNTNGTYILSKGEVVVAELNIKESLFKCEIQMYPYENLKELIQKILDYQHDIKHIMDAIDDADDVWCLFDGYYEDIVCYDLAEVYSWTHQTNIDKVVLPTVDHFFKETIEILDKESLVLIGFQKAYNVLLNKGLNDITGLFHNRKLKKYVAWLDKVIVEAIDEWFRRREEGYNPVYFVEKAARENGRTISLLPILQETEERNPLLPRIDESLSKCGGVYES